MTGMYNFHIFERRKGSLIHRYLLFKCDGSVIKKGVRTFANEQWATLGARYLGAWLVVSVMCPRGLA